MEKFEPIFSFKIGSIPIDIGRDIIVQWVIILILGIISYLLTRNLKKIPDKKQSALELFYTTVADLVEGNMGESFRNFIPYVGSLMIFLLTMNFTGLVGVAPPTKNLSVTVALAISSFLVVNGTAIKRNGFGHYLKGYAEPFIPMLPLNIMERVVLPVSLALRLFGNMLAATILVELVYEALGHFGVIFKVGAPIIVHGYFDMFDGGIQMIVFTMLTIINIKLISEH
ncbi:F-type H+-transporting ATPase subunit a [Clostridium cavendishii DSM 21758]|uniref:ATP synthase subunit a n=1 Tax=Clostridium cavendishii DSM 21758 TaxID=1121302 RepID=A0A1M6U455_9CLOT|nr:F0F1 ATP synthase subunit A [Clostridium cavendishii]SHK63967.1 F-type H+-transporting ATPase subunit a [Clostridium cavendishii DSM 21758]